MKTLILALGVTTMLAAPAFAQSGYDDTTLMPPVENPAVQTGDQAGIDYSTTQSIDSQSSYSGAASAGLRLNQDSARGNQGEFFGANGR